MGRITILVVGVLFFGLGVVGTYNAINTWGEKPESKSDVSTTGTVTDVTVTELKHAIGVTLDRTYEMEFEFQAEDGKTYRGQEIITEAQANALREGRHVAVKYHSHNPDYNAAVNYGSYTSANAFQAPDSQSKLIFCIVFAGLGALITLYAVKFAGEPETGSYAMSA